MPLSPYIATNATYAPDKYYTYADLTTLLQQWQRDYPQFLTMESIGRSYEGRDIWGVTLTNRETGADADKPGYYIDANIHAGEVIGSSVVLYTLHWLLTHYATDAKATYLLDHTAFYLVPRISVDGAELYLTTPTTLRSSVRPDPNPDERDGLRRKDLNGDGFVTTMRVPDPTGPWKKSAHDPRLMLKRAPDDLSLPGASAAQGEFYRVYPEGELTEDPKGGGVTLLRPPYNLDVNRDFPAHWLPDTTQAGAGAYPLSQPETRACADWVLAHPNICGTQHYHTWSGVILRASSVRNDDAMPLPDVRVYTAFGEMGTQETGYPCVSVYQGFMYPEAKKFGGIKGVFMDWVYDHLGLYSFSTELWNINKAAGIEITDFIADRLKLTEEDQLKTLRWADANIPDEGFVPWQPFDHPQLGPVEIGGWNFKFTHQNPPGPLMRELAHGNAMFTLRCAASSPHVHISQLTAEPLAELDERYEGGAEIEPETDEYLYRVRAVVENLGFLPTWVSDQAKAMGKAKPVTAELSGEGFRLLTGKAKQTVGDLAGRNDQYEPLSYLPNYANEARKAIEWIVAAPAGTALTVTSVARNGGTDTQTLTLPEPADG